MRYYLTLFLFFLILISCKKKDSNEVIDNDKSEKYIEYIEFPDSIKKNEEVFGAIKIDLKKIDTLNVSSITDRFMFLYVTTEKVAPKFDSIKKVNHKIFVDTVGNGIFNFKATFINSGDNVLTTVLEDVKMFRHDTIKDVTPIHKKYTSISMDVFVAN